MIKLQDKNRDEVNDKFDSIVNMIRDNYNETQQFTLVHCYLSVGPENLRIGKMDKIEIKMKCGRFFPIHKALSGFKVNRQVVWAIFDCDRVNTKRVIHAGIAGG